MASPSSSAPPKRIRLSLACDQCRKRKVKCDTEIPKCRNCWLRDEVCETTDPRCPDAGPSVRRWATKDGLLPGRNSNATHQNQNQGASHATTPSATITASSSEQNHQSSTKDRAARYGSRTRSVTTALTEVSRPQQEAVYTPSSLASDQNSTDTAALSWASRRYQEIRAGNGRDSGAQDFDPDCVVNTDVSSGKVKYVGGSNLQALAMFVDLYLRRNGLQDMSSSFRHGMHHVEEFSLAPETVIPSLPDSQSLQVYLDTFFTRIWPIYPAVDRSSVEADIDYFHQLEQSSPGGLRGGLTSTRIPQLIVIFSIITLGADEAAGEPTEWGGTYLSAAYSLFAHLIASPYLTSVQASLLLAVTLRHRYKDGQAWHVLAQAIRIAHSIGLHRNIRSRSASASRPINLTGTQAHVSTQRRIWWSCYALEKVMELESGRPSAINDDDVDQLPPDDFPEVFSEWIKLSRIFGQITRDVYRQHSSSASHLLSKIGRLDQQLSEWVNATPEYLKPGHGLFTSQGIARQSDQQHISSFIALQYYQAQITLLRASIVFSTHSFTAEVNRLDPTLPSRVRLLQAENICIAAARAIVQRTLELADHSIQSLALAATQLLLAIVTLALHILKNPRKLMVRSDLELLKTAVKHAEAQFSRGGQPSGFIHGLQTLRNGVSAAVELEPGLNAARSNSVLDGRCDHGTATDGRDAMPLFTDQSLLMSGFMPEASLAGLSEDMGFEELWGSLGTYPFTDTALPNEPLL
ncbi:fungal-specific transcription factor domain-containing protein [Bipolaris maydis]|uniref:fungal-specific transcription factor domain-containing protein n=1 Tax=Cochliobolus heterostrophus TaxID=5016 RepID=UPI0024DDE7B3|nr:hypothetical protein BM1_06454 [Bipolaris maydis]KAJ5029288.1 fungal-specific transcription factor domain-containing protein [Bipolaris maydis]KAJ5061976.1 fungal-specific transcription factor domain-containing protein [Bipolaris maydis]KAJ6192689.1 fungal-specific transcription factor domain-containing protein [Bipolaris maydis]KAJ6276095.1 fungal-specific transcription factor domain-containing protein [Bipolaris maydis]